MSTDNTVCPTITNHCLLDSPCLSLHKVVNVGCLSKILPDCSIIYSRISFYYPVNQTAEVDSPLPAIMKNSKVEPGYTSISLIHFENRPFPGTELVIVSPLLSPNNMQASTTNRAFLPSYSLPSINLTLYSLLLSSLFLLSHMLSITVVRMI